MSKLTWMKWYPDDWMRDTRQLSTEAKGCWIEILMMMWNATERGRWTGTYEEFARVTGQDWQSAPRIINELSKVATVTIRDTEVTLENRRMIREDSHYKNHANRQKRYRSRQPSDKKVTDKTPQDSSRLLKITPNISSADTPKASLRGPLRLCGLGTPENLGRMQRQGTSRLRSKAPRNFWTSNMRLTALRPSWRKTRPKSGSYRMDPPGSTTGGRTGSITRRKYMDHDPMVERAMIMTQLSTSGLEKLRAWERSIFKTQPGRYMLGFEICRCLKSEPKHPSEAMMDRLLNLWYEYQHTISAGWKFEQEHPELKPRSRLDEIYAWEDYAVDKYLGWLNQPFGSPQILEPRPRADID